MLGNPDLSHPVGNVAAETLAEAPMLLLFQNVVGVKLGGEEESGGEEE